jgi:hypothetical protein
MLRFHFPLIEPDGRISRIRLSDQVQPGAYAFGYSFRRSVWIFSGVARLTSIAAFPCCFVRTLEPGPLRSTGVTRLPRYYGPLRHPARPSRLLTESRLRVPRPHRQDFPCCSLLLVDMLSPTTPAKRIG